MPDPVCEALIFCELDIIEAQTSKHTLVGVFETLSSAQFPFKANRFFVHAIIANFVPSSDASSFVLNIKNPGIGSIIGSVGIPMQKVENPSKNPITLSARFSFNKLVFPTAGNYEAELFFDEELIGSRMLEIRTTAPVPKQVSTPVTTQNVITRAIAEYDQTLQRNPADWATFHERGNAHQAKSQFDQAITDYNETIRLNQTFWAVYHDRGNAYRAKGESDKALADYGEAIRLNPNAPHTYTARADTYLEKGKLSEAIADYDQAIALLPTIAKAHIGRALAYQNKGDLEKAIVAYNEAIRLDPKNARFYTCRGDAYRALNKWDQAIADFGESIRLNPSYGRAYFSRGLAFAAQGSREKAIADYDEALRIDPQNAKIYYLRGIFYQIKGDWDKAIENYDEAIRLPSLGFDKAKAFNFRGYAYKAKGNFDKAIPDFDEAIRLNPNDAEAHNNRGDAYRALSKCDQAFADFDEAIRLNPQYAEAYYNRGVVHQLKGNYDQGMEDYDEAIRINPNYEQAKRMRQIAIELRGAKPPVEGNAENEPGAPKIDSYKIGTLLGHLFGQVKDAKAPVNIVTEKESMPEASKAEAYKTAAMKAAIASCKEADPLVGLKIGAKEINHRLMGALKNDKGVHIETLLTILGSLAGFACQMSLREELIKMCGATENSVFVIVGGADGRKYYFGDPLNKPLAESQHSIWSLTAGAAQKLGCQVLPDLQEIFKHVSAMVGGDKFGIPRVPDDHRVNDLPISYVRSIWPKILPVVMQSCEKPSEWPVLFGIAIQESILMAKDVVDPALAVTIVMECAIPMSKVDLPEFYESPMP